jgi:hypothetical protein
MKRKPLFASLALFIAACDAPTSVHQLPGPMPGLNSSDATPIHKVTGGGQYIGSSTETYGFTARKDADGNVKGQVQMQLGGLPAFHGEATCLAVSGNSGWIGGVVTSSQDETIVLKGMPFWFRVIDNEASGTPDRISFIRLGLAANICNEMRPAMPHVAWTHGQIVVR